MDIKVILGEIIINKKAKLIIPKLFSVIISLYFYTLLHEGGHALVAIICGGKVDKFVLGFNAHVSTSGASFTKASEALFVSMGALLPVIFFIIALIIYKANVKYKYYHVFYGNVSFMIVSSLLAWVIIPFLSLFTPPPLGDDVTRFLDITGMHPLIVIVTTLLMMTGLVFFICNIGLFRKYKEINGQFFKEVGFKNNKTPFLHSFIGILLGIIIVIGGFIIFTPKVVLKTSFAMEYNTLTENVNLPFSVNKNKTYKMDLELESRDILTDVQIYDDNGGLVYQNTSDQLSLDGIIELDKGNYVFTLTFMQNQRDMQEHFKSMEYTFDDDVLEMFKGILKEGNLAENHSISCSATIK